MNPETNGHGGLTREQILAAIDMKIEAVDVPEWGGTVYIRNLTGKAREKFERSRYRMVGKGLEKEVEIIHENTRASLLAATICTSDGTLLFSAADVEALSDKNGAVLDRLFDVAQRLSAMRKEDVEDRAKN